MHNTGAIFLVVPLEKSDETPTLRGSSASSGTVTPLQVFNTYSPVSVALHL